MPHIYNFPLMFCLVRGLKTGELQPNTDIHDVWEFVKLHLLLFSNHQLSHRVLFLVLGREGMTLT